MILSRKRILSLIVIFLLLFGLTLSAIYLKHVRDYKRMVEETVFDYVDVSNIPDGVYMGDFDVNFIYAKVEVTVKSGAIAKIDILEHKNERGKPAEIMIDKIVEEQKIDVAAVAGATNSSIVIKKAVENALKGSIIGIKGYHHEKSCNLYLGCRIYTSTVRKTY